MKIIFYIMGVICAIIAVIGFVPAVWLLIIGKIGMLKFINDIFYVFLVGILAAVCFIAPKNSKKAIDMMNTINKNIKK